MKRFSMIITGLLMFFILLSPSTVNLGVQALTVSGPVPIPGNIFPATGTGAPNIPSTPNLSTAPTGLSTMSLYSINKVQSGLVASDPLNNETKTQQQLQANPGYWFYGGDAPAENAPYDFYKNTQGLHIGVQAPSNGTWAGFYAVTPSTNAALFHAVITTPVSMIPSKNNWYENGLYVQTTQPVVSYVTCVSVTSSSSTIWAIVSTVGNANQSTQFNVLWVDSSTNQPLTRDCTIITNGDNYLKVYLDGVRVYSSNTLQLNMPGPFYAFLEPQSNYAGQLLEGTYKDYYAASGENIQVTNNPILASKVDLVDSSNHIIASAPVNSGTAILNIGQFHMPLSANIKVYDSNNIQLASTSSPVNIFSGDVYKVKSILGL
jgi:hypothetical protein